MQKNRICQSVILALATFIAALSWGGLRAFLYSGVTWLWPFLGFLALLILLSIGWFLLNSKVVLFTTLGIILGSFFVVFGFNPIYLIAVLIAFACFLIGSLRVIEDKKSRIKINISRILKTGLPIVLTGLSIVIATAYFYSPTSLKHQGEIKVPKALFDVIISPALNLVTKNVSNSLNIPLDQINQSPDSFDLEALVGSIEGLGVAKTEVQSENFYQIINQQINNLLTNYKQYIAIAFAISIFFGLKFISFFFMWLVILLTWLIFKLLVKFEAIHIQERGVLQQVIES